MKCENGHETGLKLFCSVCGKPVSYKNAIDIVLAIPEFKIKYEKAALVSLDFKINSLEEMYAATLEVGDDSTITENRFVAKLILGGSWYDYIKAYEDEVRRWMNIILYDTGQPRMLTVDFSNPLSVCILKNFPQSDKIIVIGIVDDESKALISQNLNFVNLYVLEKRRLPSILISKKYTKRMGFYIKGKGVLRGNDALSYIISKLASELLDIINLMMMDVKLNIWAHTLAALISASEKVYSKTSNYIKVLLYQTLAEIGLDDVKTAYLLAWMQNGFNEVKDAFLSYSENMYGTLLNLDIKNYTQNSMFSDLILIAGINPTKFVENFRKGYESSLENNPSIGVDSLKW